MPRYETFSKKLKHTDQVDFRTPKYLFNYLNELYAIDYDAACIEGVNNLAPALRLEEEWPKGVVYSNPPFDIDSIVSWIKKGYLHSRSNSSNVHIMLVPNKITQVKFQKVIHLIDKLIFLGGRVNFESIYSVKGGTSRNGSIILIQKIGESGFENKLLSELKEENK